MPVTPFHAGKDIHRSRPAWRGLPGLHGLYIETVSPSRPQDMVVTVFRIVCRAKDKGQSPSGHHEVSPPVRIISNRRIDPPHKTCRPLNPESADKIDKAVVRGD